MRMTWKENGEFYVVIFFSQPGMTTLYVLYGLILFVEIRQDQWNSFGRMGGNIGCCMYLRHWMQNFT